MSSPRATRGLLVAIEGIDGVGKSTLQRRLLARLRARGVAARGWREPSNRVLGRRAQEAGPTRPWLSAVFFTLDRARARPRLERLLRTSDVVVSDRSYYSTLAYQGSALPPELRRSLPDIQREVTLTPDMVLWLRLPVPDALRRVAGRGGRRAPLERRRTLTRVARAYASLAHSREWEVLDARHPVEENANRALESILRGLRARGFSRRP